MRKILISLMTLVVVVGLVGGGAFAYFSDVETSSGNTFTAGTIDIAVDGDNPWNGGPFEVKVAEVSGHAPGPMEMILTDDTLLKPCQFGGIIFQITNVGNNPADIWKHIDITDYDTGITVYPEANPVASSEPEYVAESGTPVDNIGTKITYDLLAWIDVNKDGVLDQDEVITQVICHTLHLKVDGDIACNWIYLGELAPGETMTVIQSYHMQPEADNEYQGDVMTFDIELLAQQTTGGAPSPTPELPSCSKP